MNEVQLHHHPASHMIDDLLTKPLHVSMFSKFRRVLLGHSLEWVSRFSVVLLYVLLSMLRQFVICWHVVAISYRVCSFCIVVSRKLIESFPVLMTFVLFLSHVTWKEQLISHFNHYISSISRSLPNTSHLCICYYSSIVRSGGRRRYYCTGFHESQST